MLANTHLRQHLVQVFLHVLKVRLRSLEKALLGLRGDLALEDRQEAAVRLLLLLVEGLVGGGFG